MATLIDIEETGRQEDEDNTVEELDTVDSQEQPTEEDIPDKYRGKSASDLVRMHQEAERMLGRQSGEVGELRKVVDEFVMSQSTKKEETVDEEVDYFSDPEKAIQQAIEKHPAVQEAQKASMDMKKSSAQAMLNKKHMSTVMGHVQDRQIAYAKKADGTRITGLFAGICYKHDETYLAASEGTSTSLAGVWVLNECDGSGAFDEMPVSLNYLERKYGKA